MLQFNLNRTLEILERTPVVLENLLFGLSEEWLYNNEGKKRLLVCIEMGG